VHPLVRDHSYWSFGVLCVVTGGRKFSTRSTRRGARDRSGLRRPVTHQLSNTFDRRGNNPGPTQCLVHGEVGHPRRRTEMTRRARSRTSMAARRAKIQVRHELHTASSPPRSLLIVSQPPRVSQTRSGRTTGTSIHTAARRFEFLFGKLHSTAIPPIQTRAE
jgi:hypothetical protein